MTDHPAPDLSALVDRELAGPPRWRHVALGLGAGTATALIAVLWLTEPSLPLRTHLAFAGLVGIGSGWVVVAVVVLRRRRPLYAADRVLAAGYAVAVAVLTTVGATWVAALRGGSGAAAAVGAVGAAVVVATAGAWARARASRRLLLELRAALESGTGPRLRRR